MNINHKAIRNTLKFVVLSAFIASIMWRLYNIMKYGGSLEAKNNNVDGVKRHADEIEYAEYPDTTPDKDH